MQYIVHRYSAVFLILMDKLSEQLLAYQLLANKDIPASVKESAQLKADDPNCVDVLLAYLKIVKKKDRNV